jgi:hypothetical protein
MQNEEIIEEVIVLDRPWYSLLSAEDWVVLAITASAMALGVLACRQLQADLLRKLVLAGASGLLCHAVYYSGFDGQWPGPLFHAVSGALFAVGVLFPYLMYDKTVWLRGFGLIALSTLSYWSAIETAIRTSVSAFTIGTEAFLAASIVGAFIVLTGARFIAPLHRSVALAGVGFPAAIIGGLAFALTEDRDNLFWGFVAFSVWHVFMASAIHIAESWPLRTGRME